MVEVREEGDKEIEERDQWMEGKRPKREEGRRGRRER